MDSDKEKIFYTNFCGEKNYGKFHYLIGHFITSFKDDNFLEKELFPYLYSLKNKTGKINDWNSFDWKGKVCFRYDYIMILDESINQIGRKMPGLFDEKGSQLLNDEYEWLLNTEYIQVHYSEYTIISLDDFIQKCHQWIDVIKAI